ncbi:Fructosamine kinase-domain-containing protein [Xylariomycetidae sp. FL2044]|nr:Fructosamine kinase-domain-containing protein [Xylariomycetidae sp. FL2044]
MAGASKEVFVWDKEIPVPEKLPGGVKPVRISPSGRSYWARTAKIDAIDETGQEKAFFIKVHLGELGKQMVSGEYSAMSKLYSAAPEMVAEPLGWGSYAADPNIHFFICRFHQLSGDIPSLSDFPKALAEMHKRNVSPTGEFGFDQVTFGGRNPQFFPQSTSWETTFSRGLSLIFDAEETTHGPDDEMTELREGIMNLVIPRLLRPLETEGRSIAPTLVHGDLWDGNASVDVNTGKPMIFDATPLYAHHEYEMAPWWATRHKMTHDYIKEYTRHFPISEPMTEFGDRGILYCLRFDLHASSLYTGSLLHRNIAKETMRELVSKCRLGYEGYCRERGLSENGDAK